MVRLSALLSVCSSSLQCLQFGSLNTAIWRAPLPFTTLIALANGKLLKSIRFSSVKRLSVIFPSSLHSPFCRSANKRLAHRYIESLYPGSAHRVREPALAQRSGFPSPAPRIAAVWLSAHPARARRAHTRFPDTPKPSKKGVSSIRPEHEQNKKPASA